MRETNWVRRERPSDRPANAEPTALASRDTEIREVLEGLSNLRRYTHGQPERCWCDAEDPETPHMPACLAARALWEKVQER